MERESLEFRFEHLLSALREQKRRLAAGDFPVSSLAVEYRRQAEGIRDWVESVIDRASGAKDMAVVKEAIAAFIVLNKELQEAVKLRKDEVAAAMAVIRRGRNGIRKYGSNDRRRGCRFVHRAA